LLEKWSVSEEGSDGSIGNTFVDKVFTHFLKFSASGIRASEISAMLLSKCLAFWVAGKETETMTSKGKHTAFMTYSFHLLFLGTLLMIFWLRNSCPSPHLSWTPASQLAETFLLILSTAVVFAACAITCNKLC